VTGVFRAVGAAIDGLDLADATLTNEGGDALILDAAEIKGDAFLDRLTVTGVCCAPSVPPSTAFTWGLMAGCACRECREHQRKRMARNRG
jgi:hypothetical protein